MRLLACAFALTPTALWADVPRVAVDIAPIHSIVAAVMDGVGTPDLIVRPGASPHGYAMRPSEAQALDQADVVVWIGPGLTPWLDGPINALAAGATVITLMDVPGTETLPFREGVAFEGGHEGHDHVEEGHDEDGHDDHGHSNGEGMDPHAWLDPHNAEHWAEAIAATLSDIDPDNADTYAQNAAAFAKIVEAAEQDAAGTLAPVKGKPFVVFHDAYQYFEESFGMFAVGAISASDAASPSAARVAEVRDRVAELGAVCALTEPQYNPGIAEAIGAAKLGDIDPLGADLEPGSALYPQLLKDMAASLFDCLSK